MKRPIIGITCKICTDCYIRPVCELKEHGMKVFKYLDSWIKSKANIKPWGWEEGGGGIKVRCKNN